MNNKYVKQNDITDCGVACLLSVIRYYGGDNTVNNIKHLVNYSKEGINAYNLIEASKKLGFDVKGIKCNINNLNKIKLPAIAHVTINKIYKHYVIVHKIYKNNIIIFDPSKGFVKYTKEKFNEIFSNIIIELNPIRKLDVIKDDVKYDWFLNLILSNKYKYIYITIISIISIILNIIGTMYFKILIDYEKTTQIFILFSSLLIIRIIIDYIKNYITIKLFVKIDNIITIAVYNKFISLPTSFFDNRYTGDLINKFNNIEYIVYLFTKVPLVLILDVFLITITFIMLYKINSLLFSILLIFIGLYLLIFIIFKNINKKNLSELQNIKGKVISKLEENISGIETINNFNLTKKVKNDFGEIYEYKNILIKKHENSINLQYTLKDLILLFGINFILMIGIYYVNYNNLKLSDLILFNGLIYYFIEPLKNIFELEELIKRGVLSIKDLNDVLIYKHNRKGYESKINNIKIKDLNYKSNERKILSNFSLEIKNKDKIVIVGESGKGKTTLAKILSKKIKNNSIYFNNINSTKWSKESIHKNICYIGEKEKIFLDTIYNNIFFDNNVSKNKSKNIMKKAYVKQILTNKKIRVDSLLLESGNNLSYGERQRIVVARCMYKDYKVLILDECLNGLDTKLENKIIKNILNIYKDNIVIYITHRKENLYLFDRIIKI